MVALADFLATQSVHLTAVEAARFALPGAVEAMIAGSRKPGSIGHQDRMALFRIAGLRHLTLSTLPIERGQGEGALGSTRLGERLARVEAMLGGRMPVTVDAELVDEDAPAGGG